MNELPAATNLELSTGQPPWPGHSAVTEIFFHSVYLKLFAYDEATATTLSTSLLSACVGPGTMLFSIEDDHATDVATNKPAWSWRLNIDVPE